MYGKHKLMENQSGLTSGRAWKVNGRRWNVDSLGTGPLGLGLATPLISNRLKLKGKVSYVANQNRETFIYILLLCSYYILLKLWVIIYKTLVDHVKSVKLVPLKFILQTCPIYIQLYIWY